MTLLYIGTASWLGCFLITIGRLAYDEWQIERAKKRGLQGPKEIDLEPQRRAASGVAQ